MSLSEFDFDVTKYINRTTILFGETGTGKSTIIKDLLFRLQSKVDQIVVFAPTDRQNPQYTDIVPLPCIHYDINEKILEDIWNRQNALAFVYKRANNEEILKQLFEKLKNNQKEQQVVDAINRKYQELIAKLNINDPNTQHKLETTNADRKDFVLKIYKKFIDQNVDQFTNFELSEEEAFVLKFRNLNPHMVIIFDDCTSHIKNLKNNAVLEQIFYQGRHGYLTVLMACHTDKALTSELKKNAYISVFLGVKSANTYFHRSSNEFSKEEQKSADAACKVIFANPLDNIKLVYTRYDNKIHSFKADLHKPFTFGSPIIREYCKQIRSDTANTSVQNRFIKDFA